ncbi:hypothetical protein ACM293_004766, partial [Escherichia coli]
GWAILLRQKQKKLIMLPSETMIWQPEFTDKTLSRNPGAVQTIPPTMFCDGTLPPFRYLPASTGTRMLSNKPARIDLILIIIE